MKKTIHISVSLLISLYGFCQIDLNKGGNLLIEFDKKQSHLTFQQSRDYLYDLLNQDIFNKDLYNRSNAYRRLGILYKNIGLYDSALAIYKTAFTYAEKSKGLVSQEALWDIRASNLDEIGNVYYELKNYKQALDYYKQSFQLSAMSPPFYLGMSLEAYKMANVLFEQGKIDSAQLMCLQSIEHGRKYKDTTWYGSSYYLLSKIALKKNQLEKALHYSTMAIRLLNVHDDARNIVAAIRQKALVYEVMQKPDRALNYFQKAFATAKFKNYKKEIAQSARDIALFYGNKNEKDSAIKYLQVFHNYSDTLSNENLMRISYEMLTKYDTEKKEIALVHQTQINKQMKIQIIILTILVLMLIVAVFFILRSIRQQRKMREKDMELNRANAMLRGQDEERERIARELHDRVGSMLSTVKLHFTSMEEHLSGLLKQQRSTYEKTIYLLDETYEEVRRISHDLDTGLLGQFGLRTAMVQLVQLIQSANKLKIQYIDNDLEPELYKNYETDLYRITQELLSNTLKYANAKEITIQLSRINGNLVYSYEDDGKGFAKEILQQSRGIGYKNIEARVKKMNGTLYIDTRVGHGLNLIIEISLS